MEITTNKLEYQFKYDELNEEYSGATVYVPTQDDFVEFHKLLKNKDVITYTFIKNNYFLLLLKKDSVLCNTWDGKLEMNMIRFSPRVLLPNKITLYKNHFFQLLLNQLTAGDNLLPAKNLSSDLIITKPSWITDKENFRKQIFGLNFKVGWDQTLSCNVVTFTATSKKTSKYDLYEFDNKKNIIRRNIGDTSLELFEKINILKRNEVEFVLLRDMSNFDESKIGVISKVISNIEKHFGNFFEGGKINFVTTPVIKSFHEKLPITLPWNHNSKRTWSNFFGETINIYCSSDDEPSINFFNMIYDLLSKSKELGSYGINFKRNNKSVDGLNIQVIRDARNNADITERYELGTDKKYIQHITPDGLGKLNRKNQILFHKLKGKDISINPGIINTAENLSVKKQIAEKKLINFDPKVLEMCDKYSFFWFEWMEKAIVKVTKFHSDKSGNMIFTHHRVRLDKKNKESEYSKLCFGILSEFGIKNDIGFKKNFWGSIEYAVQVGSSFIAVRSCDKQIFPKIEVLRERQEHADSTKLIKASEIISNIKYLASNNDDLDYQKTAVLIISIIEENFDATPEGSRVAIGDVRTKLKDEKINFRTKVVKDICRDLEHNYSYTFNNSSRQTQEIDCFVGFKGMGLVMENGKYYYYVGSTNSVKETITRATRLREIVGIIPEENSTTQENLIIDSIEDLMKMMNVGFVRVNQYTVRPFPIKYIREYCDYQNRKAKLRDK